MRGIISRCSSEAGSARQRAAAAGRQRTDSCAAAAASQPCSSASRAVIELFTDWLIAPRTLSASTGVSDETDFASAAAVWKPLPTRTIAKPQSVRAANAGRQGPSPVVLSAIAPPYFSRSAACTCRQLGVC